MLFKYCCRNIFFDSGFIRFTPPGGLNDPDEARPELVIGKYAPADYAQARETAAVNGIHEISDADLESLFLNPFPLTRYDDKSYPGLWPAKEPRIRNEPFLTQDELDHAIAERAVEACLATADRHLGILSLSASSGEPMWAYYADDHKGIAIGFHESHDFFKRNLHPVAYSDEPIHITTNSGWVRLGGVKWDKNATLQREISTAEIPLDLLLRKRNDWICEKEWRMILPLDKADKVMGPDQSGYKIHLFQVPPDAVRQVVFGYKANDTFINETLNKLSETKWKHLSILKRRRSRLGKIDEERLR